MVGAAPVAFVEGFDPREKLAELALGKREVVRVRMPDTVHADPFHHEDVRPPVLPPEQHVMARGVMDAAGFAVAA